jgi:hypothetical protein
MRTGLGATGHTALAGRTHGAFPVVPSHCTRLGPESQNRDGHPNFRAHLEGAVAWVCRLHPERGAG